jgi:hypothetical protein
LSPQTRRGRATTASRKARGRADAGPNSQPIDESPRGEGPAEAPVESRPRSEGKRAKVPPERRKKQHGTAYRWIRAYLPILALLFALLGVVWVYTSFINPPPPTPAQQWARIEAKWSPARERARQAIAADTLDFAKQQADYKDFYTQTKGWVDAVAAVKDWGVGANDVTTFLSDGQLYVGGLEQINAMKTANDVAALSATISQSDSAFTADVLLIKADFKLSVTGPTAPPLAFPSVNPTPTGVPGASGSAAPSAGPSTSAAPAAISSPTPSPSAVASPTSSPS